MKNDTVKAQKGNTKGAENTQKERPVNTDLRNAIIVSEIIAPPLAKRKSRRI